MDKLPLPIGSPRETHSGAPAPNSKPMSPEQAKHRKLAATATAKLFRLVPPLDIGSAEDFITEAVRLFEGYPAEVLEFAPAIIAARSDRPTLKLIAQTCDELYAPIERAHRRARALAEHRAIPLPAPSASAESKARISAHLEELHRRLA